MYFAAFFAAIVALAASAVTGFIIPEGQPQGLHLLTPLANGTEVHTRIENIPNALQRRASIGHNFSTDIPADASIKCFPEEGAQELNHYDCDVANGVIDSICDGNHEVDRGHSVYYVKNCVVAYFCHLDTSTDDGPWWCSYNTRSSSSKAITKKCGWYKPGQWSQRLANTNTGKWQDEVYGYENYCSDMGKNYCHHGL